MCTQVKELEKLLNAIYMFMKVKVPEHVYSCALGDCRHEIFFPVSISLSVKILIFNKTLEPRTLGIIFEFGNACSTGLDITVLRFHL